MYHQINLNIELQFLIYLIVVIMGIQLSFFFLYRFYMIKDIHLPLNRVLLAFGSFIFLIVVGPLFIQISRNFIDEGLFDEIIYRFGWALTIGATVVPSFFIIRKEFSVIIDLTIAKILMVLDFLPLILLLFIDTIRSPFFFTTISLSVLNGLYIIRFMIILIKKSVGKIKKKFKLFFIGTMISLPSLIYAIIVTLQILPPIIQEIVYFLGVGELLIGFIIIYFSVYDFPPFYEFEWRNDLKRLFIINNFTKDCLFYYNFEKNKEEQIKNITFTKNDYVSDIDKIIPGGIIGIEQIVSTITGTLNKKIESIKGKDSVIFIEQGIVSSRLSYILIVKNELESFHHFLNSIRKEFESFFKEILINLDKLSEDKEIIFSSFIHIINNLI